MRMKTRQFFSYLVFAVCFILFISMYMMMNNIDETVPDLKEDNDKILLVRFKESILKLKEQLDGNEAKIQELKDLLSQLNSEKIGHNISSVGMTKETLKNVQNLSIIKLPKIECPRSEVKRSDSNIKMSEMYEKLPFDNQDGGAWKQGFQINYLDNQWNATNKLQVFVIPHSHTDPGWIKTFEQYYHDQTSQILHSMVNKLEEYPRMRFIYAEMSFFSMWWKTLSDGKRNRVLKLLKEGRLELVTGGWVMADEANSHYFALLDQMIEGNQWINNILDYKPRSGWSIDPFGHSPTMSYLLKRMSFDNMLIQRIHYSVKKELSMNKQLEFFWRQGWDEKGSTDMFCHMMPFYSYDVPHTCGPDPKICCQFDFARSYRKYSCPWKVDPVPVNQYSVKERAESLLDQWRKKSQLYNHNVVLIPLGDDFRYDTKEEWRLQHDNYIELFDFMNSNKDWNVEAKFATLSEYFQALKARASPSGGPFDAQTLKDTYPTLSGDFFVYADRDQHYWSGYFTSRPFYKKLDRELEHHQRLAEILLSLALAESRKAGSKELIKSYLSSKLVAARRYLGLFQHHDGITGTAKDHVVNDYGEKMLTSIKDLKLVILSSSHYLLLKLKQNVTNGNIFELDETRANHFDVPVQNVVDLSLGERTIYFFNSLAQTRVTMVTFPVTSAHVEVKDDKGNVLMSQVDPIWLEADEPTISADNFKLSFVIEVPPLGFSKLVISSAASNANKLNHISRVKVINRKVDGLRLGPFTLDTEDDYVISKGGDDDDDDDAGTALENADVKVVISRKSGMTQWYVNKKQNDVQRLKISFFKYGSQVGKEMSGAYLFLPSGPAVELKFQRPDLRVTIGPLYSEATTRLPLVVHTIRLSNQMSGISSGIEISNMVDIRTEQNTELSMAFVTDVSDQDGYFYTDLNGYQIIRRKYQSKLPLQANFYPMTSAAYLENNFKRFTLLSAHSLGVASLAPGCLEVMQDRRLNQDDNRGLQQGVQDNKRTPNKFRILLEGKPYPNNVDDTIGFFTLKSHYSSLDLLYPVFRLVVSIWSDAPKHSKSWTGSLSDLANSYSPLKAPLACDLHLVNMRVMIDKGGENNGLNLVVTPSNRSAMILHRMSLDCGFVAERVGVKCSPEHTSIQDIFSDFKVNDLKVKSLNLLDDLPSENGNTPPPPMELRAYSLVLDK